MRGRYPRRRVVAEAPRSEPKPSPWRREVALDAAIAAAVFAGTLGLLAVRADAGTRSLDAVGVISRRSPRSRSWRGAARHWQSSS